jgi:tRNA nucleotidyltransferase/poly(A) polymerase
MPFPGAHLLITPQDALVNKVKRERVGEEISKMMKGRSRHKIAVD